jgi:hypothetical protein
VRLLGQDDEELRAGAERRLEEEGVDSLLDDPRLLNALLTGPDVAAPPGLVFYVLVRQALLEGGIDDPGLADYVSSLILGFGNGTRAYRISEQAEEEYHYLVDVVASLGDAGERKAFLLRAHLGNYSLWISGLFPDYVEARVRRRGAPPIRYYEQMGSSGYRMAADSPQAEALGMDAIFRSVSDHFAGVRVALNRVSDRYLWPNAGNPVDRLLREVSSRLA